MNSTDLTTGQYEALKPRVAQMQRFLNALVKRMDARGFPPGDGLYQAAMRARAAVQDMATHVHYGSCESGVARAPKK